MHIHLVGVDASQVWPEGHVYPDDVFCEESSRAAAGGWELTQGASRVTVRTLIRADWPTNYSYNKMHVLSVTSPAILCFKEDRGHLSKLNKLHLDHLCWVNRLVLLSLNWLFKTSSKCLDRSQMNVMACFADDLCHCCTNWTDLGSVSLSLCSSGRHADAIFTNSYRKVLGQISARKFLQTIMGKRLR